MSALAVAGKARMAMLNRTIKTFTFLLIFFLLQALWTPPKFGGIAAILMSSERLL
jgi:hypothetical protein